MVNERLPEGALTELSVSPVCPMSLGHRTASIAQAQFRGWFGADKTYHSSGYDGGGCGEVSAGDASWSR
jgi:hypothetical protein